INSVKPYHPETEALRAELSAKYDIPVLAMSVESMRETDVLSVLREALYEFPVLEVNVNLPSWVMVLKENHWLRESYQESVK
ncbi:stage IV sporulation protein A, partial [Peribacillus simplex]